MAHFAARILVHTWIMNNNNKKLFSYSSKNIYNHLQSLYTIMGAAYFNLCVKAMYKAWCQDTVYVILNSRSMVVIPF
jgi:hypothetical protein